jgi:hypothetical protein
MDGAAGRCKMLFHRTESFIERNRLKKTNLHDFITFSGNDTGRIRRDPSQK